MGITTYEPTAARRVLTVDEYMARYKRSRTGTFADIAAGRLTSFRAGRRRLIPVDAAEALLHENIRLAREVPEK